MRSKVTQSLLLLPLGSSQRDQGTPNSKRHAESTRPGQRPASLIPRHRHRHVGPVPRGSRRSAARSTRRLGVSRKPQRSSWARDPTGGAHPSERERPPDILKRIPPSSVTPRVVAASQNFRRLLSSPPPPRHSSPPPPGSGGAMGSTRSITRSFCIDDTDLEDAKVEKDRDRPSHFLNLPKIQNQALLSGLAYCISSCSMILVNKYILSGYGFSAGIFLMLYQNIVSVTIVSTLSLSGVIPTEPLTWKLIKVWLPVNIIFVGMLITSMFSLKYINVAMLTILKNVANVLTASGETYFFKKQHDRQVWISLTLMLTLRHVMDSAKQATKSGNLNELSMVLLNNILSVPLGIILVLGFNEVEYLFETPLLRMPMFWIVITASGVLGLAISFTSMWFLHQTSATTYSLVGSLNKIPLSIAGILLFKVRTSMENSFSILFGLLAGVFFARAKLLNNSQS
uniref:Sugar phosphate transporter domain-containing protein n=1 Tax=Oryza meridionalis TaxID=40149 RepID=A0A0E0EGX2_9ORYZ